MIDLPLSPSPRSATPALMDFGAMLTPPLGGPLQRIERLGSRWRIAVEMPPMRSPQDGRRWVARLIRGKSEGVRMPFPLQGFDPGAPGAVVVDGGGQTGRYLKVKGGTPNYVFREGQFFSICTNGRHHLTMVDQETVLDGAGKATLPISPMLRVPHLDGDALAIGVPMVEGFIVGDETMWEMQLADFTALSFEVHEVV